MAGFMSSTSDITQGGGSTSLPTWLPTPDSSIHELIDEYSRGDERSNRDIATLQEAGNEQQGHLLATAMNAGNNAATEYSNRNRQAGGNAAGAGLVRAQALTGAQATAGEAKVQQARDIMAARERAAGLASQIAENIGTLRTNYLATLANYDINQQRIGLESRRLKLDEDKAKAANRWGTYNTDQFGRVRELHGNILDDNPNFNPATGYLNNGGW